MFTKKTTLYVFITIFLVISYLILKQNQVNSIDELQSVSPTTNTCKNINSEQALEVIKRQPEVQKFMNKATKTTETQQTTPFTKLDSETANSYTIHVFSMEDYTNENTPSHTATFNWYTVDKCNGKIKCSFFIYKNGKFERASEQDEYPCK